MKLLKKSGDYECLYYKLICKVIETIVVSLFAKEIPRILYKIIKLTVNYNKSFL